FKCHLTMIIDESIIVFDHVNTNANCNVLTDSKRNKVYYIINEPVGDANNGGYAWTGLGQIIIYTYNFHPDNNTITFEETYLLKEAADDGRQRMGADINDSGEIIISYGDYDAMLNVFIYDPITDTWTSHQTLSNPDQDFLMYNFTIIKNLEEFYILAIQDTAKNNTSYYQYVKLFEYNRGTWIEKIVVDYRNTEEAKTEAILVENKDFKMINNQIHIITSSSVLEELRYFIWDNHTLIEQDISFIPNDVKWIRLSPIDDDILFIYNIENMWGTKLEIYSKKIDRKVYVKRDFVRSAYVYTNVKNDSTLQVLGICGGEKDYYKENSYLYEISKIIK
ncbi:MAG: hypothetical protein PHO86_04305, partial [Bacilli bacterium]|nr:hypothetical protein [Bacilli bacterium]